MAIRNVLNSAGRGIGRGAVTMASVKSGRRSRYLQEVRERLDKVIRNNKGISLRYEGIKRILQNIKDKVWDTNIFSDANSIVFSDGPQKGKRGWDVRGNTEIRRLVEWAEGQLKLILGEIKGIDKEEIEISKEEAELGFDEWFGERGVLDMEFVELNDILKKEKKIKDRIGVDVKKKKRLISKIKKPYNTVLRIKDIARIYGHKKSIENISKYIEGLMQINKELLGFLEEEFKFERKEYQIMRVLVQGLKADKERFREIEALYRGFDIPHDLLSKYANFGTSLDSEEEKTIVYEIAPIIIKLYHLFGELRKLIIEEGRLIDECSVVIKEIKEIQRPRSMKHPTPEIIGRFRKTGEEFIKYIEDKELPIAQDAFDVGEKIKYAFKKLEELENKREKIGNDIAGEVKKAEPKL